MCLYYQDPKKHLLATQEGKDIQTPMKEAFMTVLENCSSSGAPVRLQTTREVRRREFRADMCSICYQFIRRNSKRIVNLSLLIALPSPLQIGTCTLLSFLLTILQSLGSEIHANTFLPHPESTIYNELYFDLKELDIT